MNVKKIIEDEHCSPSPHLTCCLQVWKHWKLFGHSWRSAAATSRPLALVGGSNSENSVLIHETDCVHSLNAYFTERATGTILSALCFRLKLWEWHSLYVTHILPSACLFLSDLFGRPDVVTNTQSQKHKTEWHPDTSARYESIWMETAQIWLQPFPGLTGTDTRTQNQYSLWSSSEESHLPVTSLQSTARHSVVLPLRHCLNQV